MPIHKQKRVNGILIDNEIVDLIKILWKHNYKTIMSCQEINQMIWVCFADKKSLMRFVSVLLVAGVYRDGDKNQHFQVRKIPRIKRRAYSVSFPIAWKKRVISKIKVGKNYISV